ncbi:MAG: hypothetical protein JNL67_08840 [Planctomycetaceae bacterium]|nr:hypothetical protein [Planctomycetaceae bacterium]
MRVSHRAFLFGSLLVPISLTGLVVAGKFNFFQLSNRQRVNGQPEVFRIAPFAIEPHVLSSGAVSSRSALIRLFRAIDLGASELMHLARLLKTAERLGCGYLEVSASDLCHLFLDDVKVQSYFGARSGVFLPRGSHFEVKKSSAESSRTHIAEAHQDYLLFTMAECGIHLDSLASVCGRNDVRPLRSRFDQIIRNISIRSLGNEFSLTIASLILYGGYRLCNCEVLVEKLLETREGYCFDLHRYYAMAGFLQMEDLHSKLRSQLGAELERKTNAMLELQNEDGAWRNAEGRDSLAITSHQLEWWYLLYNKSIAVEESIDRAVNYLAVKLSKATEQEIKSYYSTWCHVARCLLIYDWRNGHGLK